MLEQIDDIKLISIVKKYIKKSPFYKKKYNNINTDTFQSISYLSKQELLEDQRKNIPFGSNLCVNPSEIMRIHRTSGTSNKPLLLALTKKDVEIVTDIGKKLFRLCGMGPNEIIINCLNYNMWMGGYTDHQSIEKTGATVIPFGTANSDNLIELIKDLNGCSLHLTPSYLSVLKDKLKEKQFCIKDLKLNNGYFAAEGGLQNKTFRENIEQEWGINAYNANYGLSEVMSVIGAECKYKNGMHFGAIDSLYVELINENLLPISINNGVIGELVLTNLTKQAQPLIRYRTGDLIEIISTQTCMCGEPGFKFNVIGRVDDMIVIKGVNFFPEALRTLLLTYQQFTGIYKVIISKHQPIEKVCVLIEVKNNINIGKDIEDEIINKISLDYHVSVTIKFTNKIDFYGNKVKLVEKV